MAFKINQISFNNSKELVTELIPLSRNEYTKDLNYYSVIIGNNGIGKSRLLSNIIRLFNYIDKEVSPRSMPEFECNYTHSGSDFIIRRAPENRPSKEFYKKLPRPSKLFAITNSLSDTFPNDIYMLPPFIRDESKNQEFQKQYYIYFGSRGRANNSSSYALINKSFDVFFNTRKTKAHLDKAKELFDFMNYKPIIKMEFPLRQQVNEVIKNKSMRSVINGVLSNSEEYSNIRGLYISDSAIERAKVLVSKMTDSDFDVIDKIYHEAMNNNSSHLSLTLDLNSSPRRLAEQQKIYQALVMLNELSFLARRTFSFTKKNGVEFYFQKASSGEVGLISMFLGLISVVKDNALIVIDEPELSLHPSWQFRYVELLDTMISDVKGCHVIIASHSHFILSDIPADRSSVITLKDGGDGVIIAEEINDDTHGSSAEDILLNVFNLPSTRNYYLSVLVTKTLEMVARGERDSFGFQEAIAKLKTIRENIKSDDPLMNVINKLITLE